MSIYYFDPSALVKYYVTEPGSTWVRTLVEDQEQSGQGEGHVLLVGEIGITEVAAALSVLVRVDKIPRSERDRAYRRFMDDLGSRFQIVSLISKDFFAAADLTQFHPLKAYDALQLAVALRQQRVLADFRLPLILVSGDRTLLRAAQAENLTTDDPFAHVAPEDTVRTLSLGD